MCVPPSLQSVQVVDYVAGEGDLTLLARQATSTQLRAVEVFIPADGGLAGSVS